MPAPDTNIPTARLPVLALLTTALPFVVLPVKYATGPEIVRPAVRPVVLAQVTTVLPGTLPVALSTQFVRFTVVVSHPSESRVFHVAPPSADTWNAHRQLFVAAKSRVCR
jgi:hypothetical protein